MEGFRHNLKVTVRYGDIDSLGHVNHAKFATYIEHGRVQYASDLGIWDGSVSDVGMILAKLIIDYKKPIMMEDGEVTVWTRCSRIGGKSFDLNAIITREKDGEVEVVAEGTTVMVTFDYVKNQTITVPDSWREAVKNYEPALTD